MIRFSLLVGGLLWVSAASAQNEADIETQPLDTGEAAATEPVAEPVAEEAPAAAEAAPVEAAPDEGTPTQAYIGLDLASTTYSVSRSAAFAAQNFDSGMYRLRGGLRLTDGIAAELHYGLDAGGSGAGEVETADYLAVFLVPTATLFETVEVSFPVGYSAIGVEQGNKSEDYTGIAYGLNTELPLAVFADDLPDLRFTLGYMVYSQSRDARIYGLNFGIRYDFDADIVSPTEGISQLIENIGGLFGGE